MKPHLPQVVEHRQCRVFKPTTDQLVNELLCSVGSEVVGMSRMVDMEYNLIIT